MGAQPFTTLDAGPAGFWPLAAPGGGPVAVSVRHLIDLSHFFAASPRAWPDALASETRRHLSGCLDAIEAAMALAARDRSIGRCLAALNGSIIWTAVQRHPDILSPELMTHMRLRAAVSLLAGQAFHGDGDAASDAVQGTSWLIDDSDPSVVQAALGLMAAEARWSARGAAMQADLPSEYFAELVWTAAAVLGTELHRQGLVSQNAALAAMTDAAHALLSRHDEETGGFALAMRLVRLLDGRDRHAELLGQALSERRYLLFAGLAGALVRVDIDVVLDVLVQGSDRDVAVLCKALGGTASDYRHLLLDLRMVRGERDDVTLVRLAHAYDDLSDEDVAFRIEALRRPAALRAKLATLAPVMDA